MKTKNLDYLEKIKSNKKKNLPKYSNGQDSIYGNKLTQLLKGKQQPTNILGGGTNPNQLGIDPTLYVQAGNIAGDLVSDATTKSVNLGDGTDIEDKSQWGEAGADALKGAGYGAMIGSVIPGVGTAVGAIAGGLVGGVYGFFAGDDDSDVKTAQEAAAKKTSDKGVQSADEYTQQLERQGVTSKGQTYSSLMKKGGYINKYPEGGKLILPSVVENKLKEEVTPFPYNKKDIEKEYNFERAKELYEQNEKGHLPSIDETNGMWLKSKKYPTAWMELLEYSLNPELQKLLEHPVINIDGYFGENQLQYLPKKANGGIANPDYEVEGGEMIQGNNINLEGQEQVASDLTKAIGATHENGGVEGNGGERVFSNRLKPTSLVLSELNKMKIKINDDDTYANIAEKLGRKKSKFEDKEKSFNPITNKTGKVMTERLDALIDLTFTDQEMSKQLNEGNMKQYKKGGKLPKYFGGGYFDENGKWIIGEKPQTFDMYGRTNPTDVNLINEPTNGELAAMLGTTRTSDYNIGNYKPIKKPDVNIPSSNLQKVVQPPKTEQPFNYITGDYSPYDIEERELAGRGVYAPAKYGKSSSEPTISSNNNEFDWKGELNNIAPQLLNLGVHAINKNQIDKQRTNITRKVATPMYRKAPNYLSRDLNEINSSVKDINRNLDLNSSNIQDNYIRKADIFTKSVRAKNDAIQQQALLENEVNNRNVDTYNAYKASQANAENEDALDRLLGENEKGRLRQDANNALLEGYMRNRENKMKYDVDEDKLMINAMTGKGISGRAAKKLLKSGKISPRMKKFLETQVDNPD